MIGVDYGFDGLLYIFERWFIGLLFVICIICFNIDGGYEVIL